MLNKVILVGNLGKNPEKHTLSNGSTYVSFTLATSESYKDKVGEWKKETTWHNIIIWRVLGESAYQRLKKGNMIYLEGKISNRSWKDDGGHQNNITEIIVSTFRLLKGDEQVNDEKKESVAKSNNFETKEDDFDTLDNDEGEFPF